MARVRGAKPGLPGAGAAPKLATGPKIRGHSNEKSLVPVLAIEISIMGGVNHGWIAMLAAVAAAGYEKGRMGFGPNRNLRGHPSRVSG